MKSVLNQWRNYKFGGLLQRLHNMVIRPPSQRSNYTKVEV